MAGIGPSKFAGQPLFANHFVLDGVRFSEQIALERRPTSAGAHVFGMADRSRVVQLPFLARSESLNPQFYEFRFEQQADIEAEWFQVDTLRASGRSVWLVPYSVEVEAYIVAAGANILTLVRPLASAKFVGFETGTFKTRAFLNGVEQQVIGTSPPAATQITVGATASGKDVETPTLVAGDEVVVRYYPAYPVIFPNHEEDHLGFNELVRAVRCFEVNKQVPT